MWVEIPQIHSLEQLSSVHPLAGDVGCNFLGLQFVALLFVHPHTGVWVEILMHIVVHCSINVHPHTGMWVVILPNMHLHH